MKVMLEEVKKKKLTPEERKEKKNAYIREYMRNKYVSEQKKVTISFDIQDKEKKDKILEKIQELSEEFNFSFKEMHLGRKKKTT